MVLAHSKRMLMLGREERAVAVETAGVAATSAVTLFRAPIELRAKGCYKIVFSNPAFNTLCYVIRAKYYGVFQTVDKSFPVRAAYDGALCMGFTIYTRTAGNKWHRRTTTR